ncbi:CCA tRNA nucleotidyltransferase [Rhizobium sp. KVB221]|uniref:CCA tRNA nucleotidyltransferase n=1 Tax=Rhizobium setariae TaxID=2801340 RepID=A0A936YSS3_9HYPH|nr:CCA tRNA nucleotidyltransferase [Rhizobium setariae]MBL0372012.1 CCA tRNA nucleotidyltransferase [Rhizobium setariae]
MTNIASENWFKAEGLQRVLALLNRDDGEARIVGGAVRNSLMGIPLSDMDIATTHRPEAVQALAEAAGIKCVPTGIKHGTVTLVVDGKPFEVTTLRKDVDTDGRHAEVEFTDDWKADAERRDLTINALYADKDGEVYDYVGGLPDIASATIRFIGSAAERIAEDHLRILRFFRFFAFYGKGRPDAEGLKACAVAKKSIGALSAERIWAEMRKLLSAPDPFRALLWMRTSGVLTEVLPETEKWGIDAVPALVRAEDQFGWPVNPLLRLAAMVPPVSDRLEAMADRLRMSGAEREFLEAFSEFPNFVETISKTDWEKLLYQHGAAGSVARLKLAIANALSKGEDDLDQLKRMGYLQKLLQATEQWQRPNLPVKGADLLAVGFKPGPEMGAMLERLEKDWIASNFSLTRDELVGLAIQ